MTRLHETHTCRSVAVSGFILGMDHETFEYYPRLGTGPRYVSSSKLYAVLRRLGCSDMGWRDRGSWYWITPNGVPFPVVDPRIDPDCKAVFAANGRRELYFAYGYTRELLARVRNIMQMEGPRPLSRPAPVRVDA